MAQEADQGEQLLAPTEGDDEGGHLDEDISSELDRVPPTCGKGGIAHDGSELMAKWWLFFLPLYWWPQGINFGLIRRPRSGPWVPTLTTCTVHLHMHTLRAPPSPPVAPPRPPSPRVHAETYLLPFQVIAIVGDKRKHLAYSMMIVSQNVGSFFGPVTRTPPPHDVHHY